MSWLTKLRPKISTEKKKGVPENVWDRCPACEAILYRLELERSMMVCPKCNHHLQLTARQRVAYMLDETPREEFAQNIEAIDRLKFRDTKKYKERIIASQKSSGESEAVIVMQGRIFGIPVVAVFFDFSFIGGSMSSAVGERFKIAAERAMNNHLPLICFSTSGGARMQEGLFSLFQMAKTATILGQLSLMKLPFISVLTDPTMGGVSASLAMLGDLIIAEPKALIGFSGPRVIEQTIRQTLPEGFQRSEFLLEHGAIDMIVDRRDLKKVLAKSIAKLMHLPQDTQFLDLEETEFESEAE